MSVSVVAVYGPFLVLALYMSFYVACSHCKSSAWMLLPGGPGVVLVEMGRRLLDLGRFSDAFLIALAMAASILLTAALVWFQGRAKWISFFTFSLVLLASSYFALALYAVIRS